MAGSEPSQVDARIVYWGIEGAGVTTNLRAIHAKLRADHRGDLRRVATRLDPSVSYPMLPIELGQVGGVRTRLQIIGTPAGPERVASRKQLLDRIDGLVLVIDCQPSRLDENLSSFDELRQSLSSYGRTLSDMPVVVQYNKRDLARSFDLESLHRKLDLRDAAVFEAVASEGTGVLQTLTTISKRVVRVISERSSQARKATPSPTAPIEPLEPLEPLGPLEPVRPVRRVESPERPRALAPPREPPRVNLEDAILLEGERMDAEADSITESTLRDTQHALDRPWSEIEKEAVESEGLRLDADLRIVDVGTATIAGERSVRVPLTLGNARGERATLSLTVSLDLLLDPDPS